MTIQLEEGIALLSGSLFDYNNPEDSDVRIEDIAVALSNVCRFAGHLHYFYPVAQHSVNASRIAAPEFAFDALMHDTAEAFTNDIPTPLKWAVPAFKELEIRIETAMAKKFNFTFPLAAEVKKADLQMLRIEKENIKKDSSHWVMLEGIDIDDALPLVDLSLWTPEEAYHNFMVRFHELEPASEGYYGGREDFFDR